MQNKINQKIPIAKMDELIAAVKDSGGGGSKIYRHSIRVSYDGYPGTHDEYSFQIYSTESNKATSSLDVERLVQGYRCISVNLYTLQLYVSPSTPYFGLALEFSNGIGVLYYNYTNIITVPLTFISDTVIEI